MNQNEGYMLERVYFNDPSGMIRDRILDQFVHMLQYTTLAPKKQQEIIQLLSLISYKMLAIWTHDQRYDSMEKKRIAAAEANPQDRRLDKPIVFEHAQDMYIELDEFLVQVKSTLDYLVRQGVRGDAIRGEWFIFRDLRSVRASRPLRQLNQLLAPPLPVLGGAFSIVFLMSR